MINKKVGIITSLGRTGTLFFSRMLEDVVPDAAAFHQVGYFNFGQYTGWLEKFQKVGSQIDELGFENIVVKKISGKWGLIKMSKKNFLNQLDRKKAIKEIIQRRKQFIENTKGTLYLEASSEYYGIIDLFPEIFENYQVIYVVRDGRDWVRSQMNFGRGGYERSWFHQIISPSFPTASNKIGDPYLEKWHDLSTFQKLSWAWSNVNRFAINAVSHIPNAEVFRFEDLFSVENSLDNMKRMISFLVPSNTNPRFEIIPSWLGKKVHQSAGGFPVWENWTSDQKQQFKNISGSLMNELGYEYN